MTDQLPPGVSRSPESADDSGFLLDRIVDGNAEYEGDDDDDDVQKNLHHGPVVPHIVSRKDDSLVGVPGREGFQGDDIIDVLHKVIGQFLFFFFVSRRIIIDP